MTSRCRSVLGTLIAVLFIPAIIGIMACLPVPIGNPERSKIDPYFSGMWIDEWFSGDFSVSNFEPFDKRTWLLTKIAVERVDECTDDSTDTEPDSLTALVAMVEKDGRDCYASESAQLYKVWLSKLGGYWFLTWELKGLPPLKEEDEDGPYWWVMRVEKVDSENLKLWLIDEGFDGFEGVKETRQAYEKVVKKNANNSEMYKDDPFVYLRLKENQIDLVSDFVTDIISHE